MTCNAEETKCSIDFKIEIAGVPWYNETRAHGDFYLQSWDDSQNVFVLMADAKTFDLPVYSRIFLMKEAWVVMQNPGNKYQVVFKKILYVEYSEPSYLEPVLNFMFNRDCTKNQTHWYNYVFNNGLNN